MKWKPNKNSTITGHSSGAETGKRRSQRSGKKAEPEGQGAKILRPALPTPSQLARVWAGAGHQVALVEEAILK